MSQSNRKRFKLASVIDRLHVENAISSKKSNRGSCEQGGNRKFVNPLLLRQRRKHVEELITVIPNGTDKTKGQVCKRLQSKPSEGGTVICELCGRRSFKSYSKTLQVAEDGGPLKMVTKRVCRQCHEVDGGPAKLKKKGDKYRPRPYYEPPLIGLTAERASKSWYFIRRDYVCKKQDKLQKNQCNENEYSCKYLSDASSRDSDTSECESDEEDTDYLSDENQSSKACDTNIKCLSAGENDIPEIHRQGHSYINDLKNDQGYQDHLALRNELHSDSDKSLSPEEDEVKPPKTFIKRPNEVGRIGYLLEDQNISSPKSINLALAVSRDKEVSNVPLAIDVNLSPSDHTYFTRPTYDINSIEDNNVSSESLLSTENTTKDVHSTSLSSEDEYVEIECLADNIVRNLLKDIGDDLEIKCLDSDENYLLNHLLAPCIRGKSFMDDDLHDGFESKPARFRVIKNVYIKNTEQDDIKIKKDNSKPSYNKGVCRLVTVVNRKRGHYKDGSFNSCFYDSRGIYCKKQDLPSFIHLDDRKVKNQKNTSKRKEIDDLLLRYSPASPIPPGPVKVISCGLDDANLTLKELKEKFWPRSTGGSNERGRMEGIVGYVCGVCGQSVKSYSSYNRNNAPAKFLKYFKDTENRIRICRACLLSPSKSDGAGVSTATGADGATGIPGAGTSGARLVPALKKNRPLVTKKRKYDQRGNESTRKFRRFSRFVETPIEVLSPKVTRTPERKIVPNPSSQTKPKIVVDSMPAGTIALNDEIGKILIRNSSPQSPLGISSFGRLNLKVVQNPNESQIKNIAQNCKTKYVIVQTAPTSGESKVQKLSSDKTSGKILCGETKLGTHGDITINGQKYKIDTEFKLNDLVKDNENAFLSAETQKDILTRLPSILKRTPSTKDGVPAQFKIVNVVETSSALSGSCITSTKSLPLPSHTQKFILQSIAPAPRKDGSQGSSSMFSSSAPTILPKVATHAKGSSFPVSDYTVVTPKKLQCIAPKTSISSSSYVSEFSTVAHSNTVSHIDTSVYPRVSNGNLLGGKRSTVILHVSKPEPVIIDTIANGGNCSETDASVTTSMSPPPALKEISAITDIKIGDNTQFPGTNLVEIRVPENIVHRAARKIIVNPPVVPVSCISCQSSTPYIISPLTSSLTSSSTSSSMASYVDIRLDIPSTDPLSDVKSLVVTNSNTGPSPIKSLYGLKSAIVTSERFATPVASNNFQNSTATSCIIDTTSCKPVSDLNTSITTNSVSQLSVTRIDTPCSTTKTPTTASHLVISASSYKPWMSTGTAISSSLVKSINELRASLTTSITTTNKTTSPFIVRSANNINAIDNSSNSTGKHIVKTKTPITASSKTAPISLNDYSSVTIRGNLIPLTKFGGNLNSSITAHNHSTSHSLTKSSVNNLKVTMTTNVDSTCSPRYVAVNNTVSSITTNNLASFSRQLQQQQETKTCDILPSKSHVVKLPQSNIISTIPPLLKNPISNQNCGSQEVKATSSSILDLNNGIKIVGTYVKSEGITPHFSITPISVTGNSQTSVSIASYNDLNNGELKICK